MEKLANNIARVQKQIDEVEQQITDTVKQLHEHYNTYKDTPSKCLRQIISNLQQREQRLRKEKQQLQDREDKLLDLQLSSSINQRHLVVQQDTLFPRFNSATYHLTFPQFEANEDDDMPIIGRDAQLEDIQRWETFMHLKLNVLVITTSRGMGKTFLLKRMVQLEAMKSLSNAGKCGRVVPFDCVQGISAFSRVRKDINVAEVFWQAIIVWHIAFIFDGHRVDNINFRNTTIPTIFDINESSQHDEFSVWVRSVMSSTISRAFGELMRLTSAAFGCDDKVAPVFLFDNAHALTQTQKQTEGFGNNSGSLIAYLIGNLSAVSPRPRIVLAGTADGNIDSLSDRSNFVVTHIKLQTFNNGQVYEMYKAFMETYMTSHPILDQDDFLSDHTLQYLIYESCQIPRLLKVAFDTWSKNREKNAPTVFDEFKKGALTYYDPISKALSQFDSRTRAIIVLCCRTFYEVKHRDSLVPGTVVTWEYLVHKAVIFPFFHRKMSQSDPEVFVIPNMFIDEEDARIIDIEIQLLVSGVSLRNLSLSFEECWSLTDIKVLGRKYEQLVASSLAAKYALHQLDNSPTTTALVPLSLLYSDPPSKLNGISVDLSSGVIYSTEEATAKNSKLPPAVHINKAIPNAHHDLILHGSPKHVAVQCKCSFSKPDGNEMKVQLENCERLLWLYLGCQDDGRSPKKYKNKTIMKAWTQGDLHFLSGADCICPLSLDLLILTKKILKKRASPESQRSITELPAVAPSDSHISKPEE